ncbi:MAG: hypothetical protein SWO11_23390, partial [Thermodesulfobacteriota bacterium]|nr:hypothetical protein [Thermodesulfobacteriota bacterium]
MSRSLNMLNDDFRPEAKKLLLACEKSGYPMRSYCTLRTPFEQAKLWRQSRTIQEIERQISTLKNYGGDFLAHCLETVGP